MIRLNTKIIISLAVAGILIIFSIPYWLSNTKQELGAKKNQAISVLPRIKSQSMFYDEANFQQAITAAEKVSKKRNIKAIVVPQHLLASELIAQQIKRASGGDIETVFIIGPNHFNVGTSDIASASVAWETAQGEVVSDEQLVNQFLTDLNLLAGPEIFNNEHAVGAIVPFVHYYLPEAKIVPIVFRSYADRANVDQVVKWLNTNLPKKSLVIFAIDFSHYLPREQADQMDQLTRSYIEKADLNQLMSLGDDNLDSPASLVTALALAQKQNWHLEIVANQNSDDFVQMQTSQTTSYFVINFSD